MIKKHFDLLNKYKTDKEALLEIRSNAIWYLKGLPNTSELKNKICRTKSKEELFNILDDYLNQQ